MIFKKLSIAAAVAAFFAPTLAQAATESAADLQKEINKLQYEVNQLQSHQTKAMKNGSKANQQKSLTAIPITTTPLLGLQADYSGFDLISNFSSINEDLVLLQTRNKDEAAMSSEEVGAQHPRVLFSGFINLGATYLNPEYFGSPVSTTSLNITAAALDTTAYVSPWVNAFVELKWNSGPGLNTLKANRAFITVGKLNRSPFYGSIGTMYVPFGRYSTTLISDPITKQMGRTQATQGALLLGYSKPNVSTQVFAFKGNSKLNGSLENVVGADANYYAHYSHGTAQLGAGLINTLSESIGLQMHTYQNNLVGFSGLNLTKQVPAYDVNAQASFDAFTLTTEFLGTTTAYATQDATYTNAGNSAGANPKALHLEGIYNFNLIHRPSSAGLFFDHTAQALGFALPENSFGAIFNTAIAKDLLFAMQYSHNIDYKTTQQATTAGTTSTITGTGKAQNIYYLQLAAYF
jgi:hypothetical protein